MASIIQYIPGLDLSDHFCLRFELACYGNYTQYKKPRYNLCQVDLDKMQTMVEAHDWEDALNSLDIYQAWGVPVFASCYESILKECVPYHVPKIKKNIYMTHEVLHAKKKM